MQNDVHATNDSTKKAVLLSPVLVVVGIVVYLLLASDTGMPAEPLTPSIPESSTSTAQYTEPQLPVQESVVEAYIRNNITTLSPTPAVLGGTFYVTRVELENGTGVVWYEDGHIALVADVTYSSDGAGSVRVDSFTVRE